MNSILESHFISAEMLRTDDFIAFYPTRKQALLAMIEKAMGKIAISVAVPDDNGEDAIY